MVYLFFSINLNPAEFLSYNLINQIRLILPLFICILLFSANLKKFKFNNYKVFSIYFYTIFFFYILFTLLNQENSNINIFWPLYMLLAFLFIHKFNSLEDRIMLTKFSIIIIISITIFYFYLQLF